MDHIRSLQRKQCITVMEQVTNMDAEMHSPTPYQVSNFEGSSKPIEKYSEHTGKSSSVPPSRKHSQKLPQDSPSHQAMASDRHFTPVPTVYPSGMGLQSVTTANFSPAKTGKPYIVNARQLQPPPLSLSKLSEQLQQQQLQQKFMPKFVNKRKQSPQVQQPGFAFSNHGGFIQKKPCKGKPKSRQESKSCKREATQTAEDLYKQFIGQLYIGQQHARDPAIDELIKSSAPDDTDQDSLHFSKNDDILLYSLAKRPDMSLTQSLQGRNVQSCESQQPQQQQHQTQSKHSEHSLVESFLRPFNSPGFPAKGKVQKLGGFQPYDTCNGNLMSNKNPLNGDVPLNQALSQGQGQGYHSSEHIRNSLEHGSVQSTLKTKSRCDLTYQGLRSRLQDEQANQMQFTLMDGNDHEGEPSGNPLDNGGPPYENKSQYQIQKKRSGLYSDGLQQESKEPEQIQLPVLPGIAKESKAAKDQADVLSSNIRIMSKEQNEDSHPTQKTGQSQNCKNDELPSSIAFGIVGGSFDLDQTPKALGDSRNSHLADKVSQKTYSRQDIKQCLSQKQKLEKKNQASSVSRDSRLAKDKSKTKRQVVDFHKLNVLHTYLGSTQNDVYVNHSQMKPAAIMPSNMIESALYDKLAKKAQLQYKKNQNRYDKQNTGVSNVYREAATASLGQSYLMAQSQKAQRMSKTKKGPSHFVEQTQMLTQNQDQLHQFIIDQSHQRGQIVSAEGSRQLEQIILQRPYQNRKATEGMIMQSDHDKVGLMHNTMFNNNEAYYSGSASPRAGGMDKKCSDQDDPIHTVAANAKTFFDYNRSKSQLAQYTHQNHNNIETQAYSTTNVEVLSQQLQKSDASPPPHHNPQNQVDAAIARNKYKSELNLQSKRQPEQLSSIAQQNNQNCDSVKLEPLQLSETHQDQIDPQQVQDSYQIGGMQINQNNQDDVSHNYIEAPGTNKFSSQKLNGSPASQVGGQNQAFVSKRKSHGSKVIGNHQSSNQVQSSQMYLQQLNYQQKVENSSSHFARSRSRQTKKASIDSKNKNWDQELLASSKEIATLSKLNDRKKEDESMQNDNSGVASKKHRSRKLSQNSKLSSGNQITFAFDKLKDDQHIAHLPYYTEQQQRQKNGRKPVKKRSKNCKDATASSSAHRIHDKNSKINEKRRTDAEKNLDDGNDRSNMSQSLERRINQNRNKAEQELEQMKSRGSISPFGDESSFDELYLNKQNQDLRNYNKDLQNIITQNSSHEILPTHHALNHQNYVSQTDDKSSPSHKNSTKQNGSDLPMNSHNQTPSITYQRLASQIKNGQPRDFQNVTFSYANQYPNLVPPESRFIAGQAPAQKVSNQQIRRDSTQNSKSDAKQPVQTKYINEAHFLTEQDKKRKNFKEIFGKRQTMVSQQAEERRYLMTPMKKVDTSISPASRRLFHRSRNTIKHSLYTMASGTSRNNYQNKNNKSSKTNKDGTNNGNRTTQSVDSCSAQNQEVTVAKKEKKKEKLFSIDDFQIIRTLGQGSFGIVQLVRNVKNNQLFALKCLKKCGIRGTKHIQHILNERDILKQFKPMDFCCNIFESLQDQHNLYMVLEFLSGGELIKRIRKQVFMSEADTRFYLAEIVLAIESLHNRSIIYRDLKPENILLDSDGHVKLIDFGFAKKMKNIINDRSYTNCGTPGYCAPEVMLANVGHNYKADMWSIGILMCEMIGGFTPFEHSGDAKNPRAIMEKCRNGKLNLPKNLLGNARDLVRQLLTDDPMSRLDIQEIKSHAFFRQINWTAIADRTIMPPFVPDQLNLSQLHADDGQMLRLGEEDGDPLDLSGMHTNRQPPSSRGTDTKTANMAYDCEPKQLEQIPEFPNEPSMLNTVTQTNSKNQLNQAGEVQLDSSDHPENSAHIEISETNTQAYQNVGGKIEAQQQQSQRNRDDHSMHMNQTIDCHSKKSMSPSFRSSIKYSATGGTGGPNAYLQFRKVNASRVLGDYQMSMVNRAFADF